MLLCFGAPYFMTTFTSTRYDKNVTNSIGNRRNFLTREEQKEFQDNEAQLQNFKASSKSLKDCLDEKGVNTAPRDLKTIFTEDYSEKIKDFKNYEMKRIPREDEVFDEEKQEYVRIA